MIYKVFVESFEKAISEYNKKNKNNRIKTGIYSYPIGWQLPLAVMIGLGCGHLLGGVLMLYFSGLTSDLSDLFKSVLMMLLGVGLLILTYWGTDKLSKIYAKEKFLDEGRLIKILYIFIRNFYGNDDMHSRIEGLIKIYADEIAEKKAIYERNMRIASGAGSVILTMLGYIFSEGNEFGITYHDILYIILGAIVIWGITYSICYLPSCLDTTLEKYRNMYDILTHLLLYSYGNIKDDRFISTGICSRDFKVPDNCIIDNEFACIELQAKKNGDRIDEKDERAQYIWGVSGDKPLICVGISPVIADGDKESSIIKKIKVYASQNGCDGWIMLNLYPRITNDVSEICGKINDDYIRKNLDRIKILFELYPNVPTLACWGDSIEENKLLKEIQMEILSIDKNRTWVCAGITQKGNPKQLYRVSNKLSFVKCNWKEDGKCVK